jgi:transposase InsO family protein
MDTLVPKDHAEAVALFRAEVIGGLARRDLARGELRAELRALAQQRFRPPDADRTRGFSVPTLERWYYAYREGGLAALRPESRSAGFALELTAAQRELICDIRREHPSASAPLILRTLVADGRLAAGQISVATIRRLLAGHGLDRATLRAGGGQKTRLRWEAERPGALWHGDVCHGAPLVLPDGKGARPVRIHALLDDASRYVVAIEARHAEREVDMLELLVRALRAHGAPDALYLDNGPTYRGDALRIACERLGITLIHARPYDAPARGKMERFWRTLREGCLDHAGALSSLHELNARLLAFVDQHYHRAPHAGLVGKTPLDVWAPTERERLADHIGEDDLRRALTLRERRRIRRDGTVSVRGVDWELDQGFLAGRVVVVAHGLLDGRPPWIEHEGKCHELRLCDKKANARRPRSSAPPAVPRTTDFDPAGALVARAAGRRPAPRRNPR